MRNGSDDDRTRGAFGAPPAGGVPDSLDDSPFALGEFVAALRRPADFGPGVDAAVMDAIRLAPAPLVVVPGAAPARPALDRRAWRDRRRAAAVASAAPGLGTPKPAAAPLPRAWRWFTRPRAVRITPLGALAAAGIAVAAVFGLRRDGADGQRDGQLATTSDGPPVTGAVTGAVTGPVIAAAPTAAAPATAPAKHDTVFVTRFFLVAPEAKQVALVGDFNQWDHGATPLVRVASGGPGAGTGVWAVELQLPAGRHSYAFLVDGQRWVADPSRPRAIGDDFGRPSSAVTVGGGEA